MRKWLFASGVGLTIALFVPDSSALAQRMQGRAGMGGQGDPTFAADRDLFHFLLTQRADIRRQVTKTQQGVETLTESDKPEITIAIQKHVASMEQRVKQRRPIHLRDPLFAEVFRHAGQIKFEYHKTEKGMRVVETSDDPYVVALIQAHASVVSEFLKNGFDEVQRNHSVPVSPSEAGR